MDGCTIYLAKSFNQAHQKHRASLGPNVWRKKSEGLLDMCTGASAYCKSQGNGVKIWGALQNGKLFVTVLPENKKFNSAAYSRIIRQKLKKWLRPTPGSKFVHVIQDRERCLWSPESRDAFRACKIKPLNGYPANSPEMNPIENVWDILRQILSRNPPYQLEKRRPFIIRLHAAVRKINSDYRDVLLSLNKSLKNRAEDCIDNGGSRIDYWKIQDLCTTIIWNCPYDVPNTIVIQCKLIRMVWFHNKLKRVL